MLSRLIAKGNCQLLYTQSLDYGTGAWSAEPVDVTLLQQVLANCAVGHTIDYHTQVASTMPLAHQRAREAGLRSGALILADEQTGGRGRQARRWETPPGRALLMSFILKAPLPLAVHEVPMAAGLAALDAIIACWPQLQGQVGLKWPNDLLLGHDMAHAGKVGGILAENSFYGASLSHAIVGMGINVSQRAAELPLAPLGAPPPISLYQYLSINGYPSMNGPAFDSHTHSHKDTKPNEEHPPNARTALLLALCHAWANLFEEYHAATTLHARWRAALWTLGQSVTIYPGGVSMNASDEILCGEAIDVTSEGHLIIRDQHGSVHTFAAGDVSLRLSPTSPAPLISADQ